LQLLKCLIIVFVCDYDDFTCNIIGIQKGITRRLGFQKRILDLLAFKLGMSDK
jgi:hypothetical protein